jgi:hypothetical protein
LSRAGTKFRETIKALGLDKNRAGEAEHIGAVDAGRAMIGFSKNPTVTR